MERSDQGFHALLRELSGQLSASLAQGCQQPIALDTSDEAAKELERTLNQVLEAARRSQVAEEERKKLQTERVFLDSIVENVPIMLFVKDKDSNILLWNRVAEGLTGFPRQQVLGKTGF